MKGVMNMKKYGLLILLVAIPLFLAGCDAYEYRLVSRLLGGETYSLHIVTSPLEADIAIDKEHKGTTPLRVEYIAPVYTEIYWDYVHFNDATGYVYSRIRSPAAVHRARYENREEYVQFVEQTRTLNIQKEGYEDTVIVFTVSNAGRKIPEVIKLVKKKTVLPPETNGREKQAPQQQQQMMGPTIVIGGKTVTGDDAVKIVNYGLIMFDSTPQGAEVLIEGNSIGFTPTSYLKFEVGTYNVEIVKSGYQSWERKIIAIQDSSIVINPPLEKR